LRTRLIGNASKGKNKARTILPTNREDGTGLNEDFEDMPFFIIEIEQMAHQNQVASGRNRQKLRQAFDDTEDYRFYQ
jgi:hypothetical protein